MSDLLWIRGQPTLTAFGRQIKVSNNIRTLANGLRDYHQVVFSENADGSRGVPYMPAPFPVGVHRVIALVRADAQGKPLGPYEAPVFISTDARQLVPVWTTIQYDGLMYGMATDQLVWDYGYGFHASSSLTTLGCLRDDEGPDVHEWVAAQISPLLAADHVINLEVQEAA